MGNTKKVQNHPEYHVSEYSRNYMEGQNGLTKNEFDYILTNRTDIVTYVTFINQFNIGSDHRMFMSNIRPDLKGNGKQ